MQLIQITPIIQAMRTMTMPAMPAMPAIRAMKDMDMITAIRTDTAAIIMACRQITTTPSRLR